jgi:hypothetical protein
MGVRQAAVSRPGDNTPYIEHAWVEFSPVEFDSQFTRVAANVILPVDDFDPGGEPTEPCRARLGVTWFLEGSTEPTPTSASPSARASMSRSSLGGMRTS